MNNKRRVILALDNMSVEKAKEFGKVLGPALAGGKANDLIEVGGAAVLDNMGFGLRMLDPKLKDIRNTMVNRMKRYEGHAEFVTVHADASFAALRAAAKTAEKVGVQAIAVTVLTDISSRECTKTFGWSPRIMVVEFAKKARRAGLHGIVCSPKEVSLVRRVWPKAIIIATGVRSPGTDTHDQERTGTPAQAILDGANYIVGGREITEAKYPRLAAQRINRDVAVALSEKYGCTVA